MNSLMIPVTPMIDIEANMRRINIINTIFVELNKMSGKLIISKKKPSQLMSKKSVMPQ